MLNTWLTIRVLCLGGTEPRGVLTSKRPDRGAPGQASFDFPSSQSRGRIAPFRFLLLSARTGVSPGAGPVRGLQGREIRPQGGRKPLRGKQVEAPCRVTGHRGSLCQRVCLASVEPWTWSRG